MTKLMCTEGGGIDIAALQAMPHDRPNGATPLEAACRRPRAQKDASAGAGRSATLEIGGDRPTDLGSQGQLVALATLAVHAQMAFLPVDVVELQGRHLARTQSQARKQKHDGVVAASGRGAPIDAGQQPTHLVRSNRARDRRHRPVGDDGNSGRQIDIDLAAKSGVAQERAQRGGHQLGALLVQARRLVPNKVHDIGGAQTRQLDRPRPKAMLEEVADERNIVDDRGFGQRTLLAQVHLVGAGPVLNRRSLRYRESRLRNHALVSKKVHQVCECPMVTALGPQASSSIPQIPGQMISGDVL